MNTTCHIDLNADVGEGLGNEADLMPFLSSCNIACGGHAGDLETMIKVVKLAKSYEVKIGAHPSFPDKKNFGRQNMNLSETDLYNTLINQISNLQKVLHSENVQLHHIKPHGALYNLAAKDENTARVIVKVVKSIALPVKLYVPYNSMIADLAHKENVKVIFEAFADRNYNKDLSLVSRQNKNALLTNESDILNHILVIILNQKVKTIDRVEVPIEASTFCVHGDTKNAVDILKFLSQELPKNKILIQ